VKAARTGRSPNGKRKSPVKPKSTTKLADFRPQRVNVNRGKSHGLAALDKSLRQDGYSAPMVAAADGEIFAGSKRLERVADVMPEAAPIVVRSDGTRPIIHVRTDIPTADDPRAKRLGAADNIIAAMDWNPDGELLAALAAEDAAVAALARQDDASPAALAEDAAGENGASESQLVPEQWLILIECKSEMEQARRLRWLEKEGIECRALIS